MHHRVLIGILILIQMLEIALALSEWAFKIPKYPSEVKNSYADILESLVNVNKERMKSNNRLAKLDSYVYGKDHLRTSNENEDEGYREPNITFAVIVLDKIADDYYDDDIYLRNADYESDDSSQTDNKYAESSGDEFHKEYSAEVNYKTSKSCRKGRKACVKACREAARDLCYAYNWFDCSYSSLCRRNCRRWF